MTQAESRCWCPYCPLSWQQRFDFSLNGERPLTEATVQHRRAMVLGAVIGSSVGLLLATTSVVLLLGPAWIWFMFFPPVLPALVVYAGWKGGRAGQRGLLPAWPYWRSVAIAATLWPVCTIGPIALTIVLQKAHLESEFDNVVPIPPGATLLTSHVVPLSLSEGGSHHVLNTYRWAVGRAEVLDFYHRELGLRGWVPGPTGFIQHEMNGTPHWFAHRQICFSVGIHVDSDKPDEFSVRFEQGTCDWI